ncbi:molybdate ABC transporter substrate-binding protein [Fibrella arboris]|uniref:molybdate ABC transporter substrate-binding protein n=1 Tax=Fibrella arboris TaxID=3242486 RepID=UPI00352082CF
MKKVVLLGLLFWASGLQAQSLRVAVAANAQFVMEALSNAFQKESGIRIEAIVNSSGKLTAQIQQGAPYDVFLSADMDYPRTLHQQQLTTGAPVVYAYGSLVLWTLSDLPLNAGLNVLMNPAVHHIAIANPETAPYGEAAISLLTARKLLTASQSRLVYGESIAQVNQYILSGAAEVGITAKSVVLDPALKQRGHWIDLPPPGYAPIAQGVVVLKRANQPAAAARLVRFLQTATARRIFQQFGYRSPAS